MLWRASRETDLHKRQRQSRTISISEDQRFTRAAGGAGPQGAGAGPAEPAGETRNAYLKAAVSLGAPTNVRPRKSSRTTSPRARSAAAAEMAAAAAAAA